MPIVGDKRILQWLATQPAFTTTDTRFAEAARSGDLGYTWGTYSTKGGRGATRQVGSTSASGSGSEMASGKWRSTSCSRSDTAGVVQ